MGDLVNINTTNKPGTHWSDYFSESFTFQIRSIKKKISRNCKKRTFIAILATWIAFAILCLPVIITGINWSGQEIDITPKFIAGTCVIAIGVSIYLIIGFNYFEAPREYAEEAEMLIIEQLLSQGNKEDIDDVILNFEKEEKVSPEIYSRRYWRTVFGIFGILCVLATIFLFVFQ